MTIRLTLLTTGELTKLQPDRATRVMHHNVGPENWRLWRKWIAEQGMPSKPNRAQRRELQRIVARRRTSPNAS